MDSETVNVMDSPEDNESVSNSTMKAQAQSGPLNAQDPSSSEANGSKLHAESSVHPGFSFKVPTLRNIELTYPYFHDGAVWDLGEAVNIMGEIQLGRAFAPEETDQIVAFLKSLTGEQPSFSIPVLPPSSSKTPKPQP